MPDTERDTVVAASGLVKTFGDLTAVDHVDFEVVEGEIVAMIGPSGSGKTTTVRLLTGAYEPDEGSVTIWGTDVGKLTRRQRRRVGYLPQLPALVPELSLKENLRFHASLLGRRLRAEQLDASLDLVDLSDHGETKAADASGGMQRRLSLVASLVHEPDLVYLDEPTAGIDPILRHEIWEYLRTIDRTMIVTTQYVGEAAYCDKVAVVAEGKLIAFDAPEALRQRVQGGERLVIELADTVSSAAVDTVARVTNAQPDVVGRRTLEVTVVDAGEAIPAVGPALAEAGVEVTAMEERIMDYDEVFVELLR